jgi:hypothetical protein
MLLVQARKFLVLALALSAFAASPAYAEANTTTERYTEPYEATITACNGEDVHLTGELHFVVHTTNANGASHSTMVLIPQGVVGVGAETGTQYRAVGGDREQYNFNGVAPVTYTNTDMYNLVSQGGNDNLLVYFTIHVTVNANGETTVEVDQNTSVCIG